MKHYDLDKSLNYPQTINERGHTMNWVKTAIGAVIAISVIPTIASAVVELTGTSL